MTDRQAVEKLKNEIQLRTTDLENEEYIQVMREIAQWADNKADMVEYTLEATEDEDEYKPIISL